jgi:hypothetical protein
VVGGMQSETNSTNGEANLDKRAILAIIRVMADKQRLVLTIDDIMDKLSKIIGESDEFDRVWDSLYNALNEGKIKHLYPIHRGKVAVSARELSDEQIRILREIAQLYDFEGYVNETEYDKTDEVDNVINNMIRMWNGECSGDSTLVWVMLNLASEYGMSVNKVENTLPKDPYSGHITYSIEDTVFITEWYYPCECEEEKGDCVIHLITSR